MAPPFRVAEFDITYGEGISKTGEIVDLGVNCDIIEKSGSWYAYKGTKIAQGREAAKLFMVDNPEVADEIENQIKMIMTPSRHAVDDTGDHVTPVEEAAAVQN